MHKYTYHLFSPQKLNKFYNSIEEEMLNNIIDELSLELDGSYIEKLNDSLINLLNSNSYKDIKINLEIKYHKWNFKKQNKWV